MTNSSKIFYNTAPIGIASLRRVRGQPLEILYANSALSHMLGAKPAALIGRDFEAVWPGAETDKFVRALKSTIPPHSWVLPVQRGDGAPLRWAALSITSDDFEGEPAFTLWATDISASKQAEAQLQQEVAQADALAAQKSNFLATMSHEIRTPMQSVYGLLELIGEEKPDDRILSMVNTAKNSAAGLLEILDDILDFAKMDADKMELDMFEVPVRTLIAGILEAMTVKIRGQDVQLLSEVTEDVPFVIIGDPKRLRQIIMNLTGNALKFTNEGTVLVRVTAQCKHLSPASHGVNLRFEIIDSGIGMSEEVRARLFTPFTQADSSTSRKFGGTGLGLSISKKLVEHMGGIIGVESEIGKGSTFWFEIPTEEVSTEGSTVQMPSLEGISVLSVEDHPQGAKEIKRTLESMGAKVESCGTIAEGLALIKRRPFDVAVVDQGLPDGLGIELVRGILDIRPFTGMIMYTARDDVGLQHTLNTLGVQYLTKPASRAGLGEAVKDAARKGQSIKKLESNRLLIAEDTESVRDVLSRQLEKLGVDVDFVTNGVEALHKLDSGEYGILFTDLHMPEMDGYALVNNIRERERAAGTEDHFPIIVLTADVQMAQRQVYMGHGFDECLLKPVSLGHLRRLLIRWGLLSEDIAQSEVAAESPVIPDDTQRPPAVDKACIRAQMGALDQNSVEMMGMFADMSAPLIERISNAWQARDFHDLKEAAHSLKGGARSACCPHLGDLAAQLQEDADQNNDCADLVSAIGEEFLRVRDDIAQLKPD